MECSSCGCTFSAKSEENLGDAITLPEAEFPPEAGPKHPETKRSSNEETYSPAPEKTNSGSPMVGLILGIAAVVVFILIPLFGILIAIAAIITSHAESRRQKKETGRRSWTAIAGFCLGYAVVAFTSAVLVFAISSNREREKMDDLMSAFEAVKDEREQKREMEMQNAIANSEVVLGMNTGEVISAWGFPDDKGGSLLEGGSGRIERWYYRSHGKVVVFVFQDGPGDRGRVSWFDDWR